MFGKCAWAMETKCLLKWHGQSVCQMGISNGFNECLLNRHGQSVCQMGIENGDNRFAKWALTIETQSVC